MSTALHIGLVGCGRWGRLILRDLKSLGCRVSVVASSDSSRHNAASGGADAIVGELPALPAADGYVVASPTVTHGEVIDQLLGRDVPVFTEKPMTSDLDAARDLAQRGAGRLFVMDKWRYHPGVEKLGEIARSGELGRVIGLETLRLGWGNRTRTLIRSGFSHRTICPCLSRFSARFPRLAQRSPRCGTERSPA
ncbi:MAG TPA: Gfo/Idh/MocA family oxidoreductase [Thermoanaerobaculia bacterium]|nr:Gfo/Idh/MocA family oxidoreductase [Thermoanaerobaculia bacterium]